MPADGHTTYGLQIQPRVGFFTDTTVCIGCKACEVACKEWNLVPEDGLNWTGKSYDNTQQLDANTWRHVAFIEQRKPVRVRSDDASQSASWGAAGGAGPEGTVQGRTGPQSTVPPAASVGGEAGLRPAGADDGQGGDFRWLMSSDVCKHCTHAGCLDVCPTGAIFRTEFGTVVIQDDVCNGCGYCVTACPFGVIGKRELGGDGGMHKCTLCYDRLEEGHEPACAKACPTDSIQFGSLDELLERANGRLESLHEAGVEDARLYGANPEAGVGGFGAFFLLLDEPEVYGLPPDPVVPTKNLGQIWGAVAAAAAVVAAGVAVALAGGGDDVR